MTKQIGPKALTPNAALKTFEKLLGDWQTIGSHPYFPGIELHGRTSFGWHEGGAFVISHSELDHEQFPDGVAIFGSDDQSNEYFMMYFDERNISRKYNVEINEDGITWWRDDAHFSQRFSLVIHDDGSMTCTGKMSRDGADWEDDLSLVCKRADIAKA